MTRLLLWHRWIKLIHTDDRRFAAMPVRQWPCPNTGGSKNGCATRLPSSIKNERVSDSRLSGDGLRCSGLHHLEWQRCDSNRRVANHRLHGHRCISSGEYSLFSAYPQVGGPLRRMAHNEGLQLTRGFALQYPRLSEVQVRQNVSAPGWARN